MFKKLAATFQQDNDLPDRAHTIEVLTAVLEGQLYSNLKNAFHEERNSAGEYVPLQDRRPSVRYGLCKLVVDDSVSLLFSEGHFPEIQCEDEVTREALAKVIKETKLNAVMIQGATIGSVGSACFRLRVLSARVFIDAMKTTFLTPVWKADEPDVLEKVVERYKIKGSQVEAMGFAVDAGDKAADFWFQRVWDALAETWHVPVKVGDEKADNPPIDQKKTTQHRLGFVPLVWVKNLPGGDYIDGLPTFPEEVIDTGIEIDYQLSQGGRALRYAGDPTLLIKAPPFKDQAMVGGAANSITVDKDGDAKLLEINGTATEAVLNYVKGLRELALETAHGNRANADKLSAAQSGRAMELMCQSLIWLADKLRIAYGEGALTELLCMVVKASTKFKLVDKRGKELGKLSEDKDVTLRWPAWFAPTFADKQTEAITLAALTQGNLMSKETATELTGVTYDIDDTDEELKRIEADKAEAKADAAEAAEQQATLKAKQTNLSDAND